MTVPISEIWPQRTTDIVLYGVKQILKPVTVHTRCIPGEAAPLGRSQDGEAYGQVGSQSVNKPIEVLLMRSRPALKTFKVAESMTC